ncbi:hypothetical protein [Novosphingobium beihaiensis]|nr:hypothetical protein [Novosphingobium beihaiensis]
MNRHVHRIFVIPSCHLADRISPGGWSMAIAMGLALWWGLFSLL